MFEQYVRKSLVICTTQLIGDLLLKMLKYFEVMLIIFEFSLEKENVESWLVYINQLSYFSWKKLVEKSNKENLKVIKSMFPNKSGYPKRIKK